MSVLGTREIRRRHEVRINEEDRDPDSRQVRVRRVERRVHRRIVRELEMLPGTRFEKLRERDALRLGRPRRGGEAHHEKDGKDETGAQTSSVAARKGQRIPQPVHLTLQD
jgi:hypothetical protein